MGVSGLEEGVAARDGGRGTPSILQNGRENSVQKNPEN
tara:strand:- start:307 stop:420 length:114 start_codon:yes stop_codon:yes gene_type:complete